MSVSGVTRFSVFAALYRRLREEFGYAQVSGCEDAIQGLNEYETDVAYS
mgnify:CR=1 FL=1